jgi:ParB family chromosome partitioning protein
LLRGTGTPASATPSGQVPPEQTTPAQAPKAPSTGPATEVPDDPHQPSDRTGPTGQGNTSPAAGDAADPTRSGTPASTEGLGYFAELPVDAVVPNPRQPRQVFDDDALAELVHSIREIGLLQPIVVRPVGADRYELVMGERRWRASRQAGQTSIPAIVRQTSDDQMLRDALLENLHRAQLNPLEEAAAYGQLLEDFGCTHDELAARIGRSRPQITNTLRLLKLPPAVQRRVAAGVLSAGHARALLGAPDADTADRLAHRVVAEGISVRALEEIVALGEPDTAEPSTRTRRSKPVAPKLADLADRLSEHFETRVKVDLGRTRGRITIEFASVDDLERIVAMIDPANAEAAAPEVAATAGSSTGTV